MLAVTLLATPVVLATPAAADSSGFPGARPYGVARSQVDVLDFPGARPYGEDGSDGRADALLFPGARPYRAS
ncbi:hypothetical protein [Goodfellowiella coeruleoviolacea]|uniref:hypothetical protein n=1 Tax=Goodfellowiella coeruleoviolacea TaxID=334858 RepID=UPI0020A305D1|nr:hypothetical protein [Goodfellowiella coeruleoviolacea]